MLKTLAASSHLLYYAVALFPYIFPCLGPKNNFSLGSDAFTSPVWTLPNACANVWFDNTSDMRDIY